MVRDLAPRASPQEKLDAGVPGMTMAYVLLIDLVVVCPVIRLLSISARVKSTRVNAASRFDARVSREC